MENVIEIMNLILENKYPYPQKCNKSIGNTILLYCLINKGLFHNGGFSYVSNKDKLITISKGEYEQ